MQIQFAFLRSKVAKRLFFLFVITAIIPIGVVGILSYNYVTSILTKQKQEHLIASSKTYGMAIYDRILTAENQFINLGENLLHSNDFNISNIVDIKLMPNLNTSLFSDVKFSQAPVNLESSDLKHLQDGNAKIMVSKNNNNEIDIFIFKIFKIGETNRFLSAKVDTKYIFGDMDIFAGAEDACVVTKNIGTLNCSNNDLNTISKSIFEKYVAGEKTTQTFSINNENYTIASWELFLNGHFKTDSWIIYYYEPSNVIFAPTKAFARTLLPALLLAILLVTLISLNQISKILVPLEKLSYLTKRIAKSDFDEKVEFTSNDEFQSLGESFNFMTSELAKREEKLLFQANYDNLTGLPNRLSLNAYIEKTIVNANNSNEQFAFLFVDLDRFKIVNDSQGHAIGDKLLIAAADRIKSSIRESGFAARYGGDEFVLIIPTTNDLNNVKTTAKEIINRLSDIFYVENYEQFIGASIGISIYPNDGTSCEKLIQKADIAMYKAKQLGRGKYVFFADTMQDDICEKAELEADLFHAIERNELFLTYQPQLELATGKTSGAEALLRWNHGTKGAIRPDRFIAYAEDNGFIIPLGKWVIREAFKQCEKWQIEHKSMPKIAINISAKQLRHENFFSDVENLVSQFDVGITYIEFEITESLFVNDDQQTFDILNRINKLGIGIAIDDFGKGYSSLSYLKKLPAQTLKIDRLFIKDLNSDKDSRNIVKAIIAMGKALHKKIVAEGVETIEQLNILKDLGCDYAQGYYISKPKLAEEFVIIEETTIFKLDDVKAKFNRAS
ncbi:MAG: EAL domain-containing protein [Gammaproteobacteria bacterium]